MLTLPSDRALWQSTMENQSLLAEVVKNQQIGFHREDISMMSAAEIISTYRDEGTDEVFRNSLELFGSRHLQRLAKGGDRVAAEAFQQFKTMAEARRENAKTPKQKQAEAALEQLDDVVQAFNQRTAVMKKERARQLRRR